MKLKPVLLAAAIAATGIFATSAGAADSGTITINGKVISQTCDVSGTGGTSDFTVTLPVVQTSTLASSAATAGDTDFSLALTNCPTTPSGLQVGTQFYSSANADSNGRLSNTAGTTPASNVAVQLLDSGSTPINVATSQSAASVTDQTTLTSSGSATLQYTARYYATGAAGAGNVSTTVEYAINYQ